MSDETQATEESTDGLEAPTRPWTVGMREKQEAIATQVAEVQRVERIEFGDIVEVIRLRAVAAEERRTLLPCHGLPDAQGIAACEAVDFWRSCEFVPKYANYEPVDCPRALAAWREVESLRNVESNLAARYGVPQREREIIVAGARRDPPLKKTPALTAVRSWLDSSPRPALLMLAGPTGIGKTVAACYAIAKLGGIYARAYALSRPGFDVEAAQSVALLVLDQSGREHVGPSAFGLAALEEIIDGRYAARLPTVLIGNLTQPQFDARYDEIIAERMRGDGQWVQLDGASLRGAK